jgi:excisionase family DNA binding protein
MPTAMTTTTTARTMSRHEVEQLLGVGRRTLWRYVQQGKIPQPLILSRRKWLFDAQAVTEFIKHGDPGGPGRKR